MFMPDNTALATHRGRRDPRRVLAVALGLSALVHLAITQWPVHVAEENESTTPLAVAITELPPPPAPVAAPAAKPKPKPRRAPPVATAQVPSATVAPEPAPEPERAPEPEAAPTEAAPADATPPGPPAAQAEAPEALPDVAAAPPPEPIPPKALPPRVDLAYRAFLGTQGFLIGQAVYRLDHGARDYSISTVAEARGLASLFFHGQGRATSVGTITANGLQPSTFTIARTGTNSDRSESALFDWGALTVLLKDNKSEPLELPTFDPLVVLWQFYFAPPDKDSMQFNIATTRKIYHYGFRRDGVETIELPFGDVDAEIWRRDTGDGALDAVVWLAPSLRYVAVKVRLSNSRATVELLLDSIRVDETVAQQ